MRNFVWSEIGNGSNTSAWFDTWCDLGSLGDFLSPRTINNAGFNLESKASDVYSNNTWRWPVAWRDTYPVLNQLDQLAINPNKPDILMWRHGDDINEFSTSCVWNSIRYSEPEIAWCGIAWFAQCIPRHAFLMWLIMKGKLLTQDKILKWDFSQRKNMNMMCCLLCYENNDSHSHLFFECKFSSKVWLMVRHKVGMDSVQPKWDDVVDWLLNRVKSKSAANYVSRLLVAASAYVIWQERNARMFKNQLRPPETITEINIQQVRYKLMGAKLKKCDNVQRLLGDWGICVSEMYGGAG
ncbi:uncharacterized protein LOC110943603 [Helianthus annuus]|uniref:uncharacterized protein LOC110943603 n=1 Tax=Helianthus annuus TaxID=4232 RepID=UPI000B8FE596|nr:uncharacterized protein LOC110943603 [Helianthus annuus]